MARVTVEDCIEKIDNRFDLVLLAAERTKQLMKGAPSLIERSENKEVVTALREVAAGRVRMGTPKEELPPAEPAPALPPASK